jgi:hypothetical protein
MATTNAKNGNNWDEKELGCLWKREKQSTKEKYLTGVLSAKKLQALVAAGADVQVVCFSNKGKTKDTHPDLRIYLSEKRPAGAAGATSTRPAATTPAAPTPDASELI